MSLTRAVVTVVLAGVASIGLLAQATDTLSGKWKLNPAKSKGIGYTRGTSVSEATADGLKVSVDAARADGTTYSWSWSAKFDGKDNPISGKTPYGANATVALTRVDAHTLHLVAKIDGKLLLHQTITTSPDGKTLSIAGKGTDPQGKPIDNLSVYDRQ